MTMLHVYQGEMEGIVWKEWDKAGVREGMGERGVGEL